MDEIAWKAIETRKTARLENLGAGGMPTNYADIGKQLAEGRDWEVIWGNFLHHFFAYKLASFFEEEPPTQLDARRRAMLAGAAEYLCKRFCLPVPEWTEKGEYFLSVYWDPMAEWHDEQALLDMREERLAKTEDEFKRRNVIFEARNLITL